MNDHEKFGNIIPVTSATVEGVEKLTCDARALHDFLEVGRVFHSWFKERVAKYGFMEGIDFIMLTGSGEQDSDTWGGQNRIDYVLTLDMAKELAMVENNERGRQVRQYFIACERRAREIHSTLPDFTNPVIAARAWADAQEQKQLAEKEVLALEAKVEADRPKVFFADAVSASETSISMSAMADLLVQNGMKTGRTRLMEQLRDEGYLHKAGRSYNLPTAKSMNLGLFEVKECVIHHSNGRPETKPTPLVTGRGQQYFLNKYCGNLALV